MKQWNGVRACDQCVAPAAKQRWAEALGAAARLRKRLEAGAMNCPLLTVHLLHGRCATSHCAVLCHAVLCALWSHRSA